MSIDIGTTLGSIPITRDILPYLMSIEQLPIKLGYYAEVICALLKIDLEMEGDSAIKGAQILNTLSDRGNYNLFQLCSAISSTPDTAIVVRRLKEAASTLYRMDEKQVHTYNYSIANRDINHPKYNKNMDIIFDQIVDTVHIQIFSEIQGLLNKVGYYLPVIRAYNAVFDAVDDTIIDSIHNALIDFSNKGKRLFNEIILHEKLTVRGLYNLLLTFGSSASILSKIIDLVQNQYSIFSRIKTNKSTLVLNSNPSPSHAIILEDNKSVHSKIDVKEKTKQEHSRESKRGQSTQDECVVCLDEIRKIVFTPCGHLCCCEKCSAQIHICPICKAGIVSRVKVYKP